MSDPKLERYPSFDEIRVIELPPPQTAAVNRLLREEEGWRLIDARAVDRGSAAQSRVSVVYVLGHLREQTS